MPQGSKRGKKGSRRAVRYAFYLVTIFIAVMGLVLPMLYAQGRITASVLSADSSIDLSLFFPLIVFSYLLSKGHKLQEIVKGLGLTRDRISLRAVLVGILLFGLIELTGILISLFSVATGIPLPTNVAYLLSGMPLYFLVFSFLIAPIDEEVLFRGFLVPRIGIVLSALLFAISHLAYLSVSEFAAAFVFGLLAGYFFKRYKSLYSTMLAHALVNFLTIAAIALFIALR